MFKNHIKIAWRNMLKDKTYSLVNIIGLSFGLASCFIISTIVLNEFSYDTFWSDHENIYRIITNNDDISSKSVYSDIALGPELKENFPEVTSYCKISTYERNLNFEKNKSSVSISLLYTEETIWDLLDLKVIEGTPQKYVSGFDNLVISKSLKEKLFPNRNVIGKVLNDYSLGVETPYLITGIIEDLPYNSHLRAEALIIGPNRKFSFNSRNGISSMIQYIKLKPKTNLKSFTQKTNNWYKKEVKIANKDSYFTYQPIKDIYLKSDFTDNQLIKGNYTSVVILSVVAFLLLVIACINFINLSTSRVLKRVRSTGLKKVLGADRIILIEQFLIESTLFFSISFCIAIAIYNISFSRIEQLFGKEFTLSFTSNFHWFILITAFTFFVSLITGIYPAIVLSRPKPSSLINMNYGSQRGTEFFKKILVSGQFVITIFLIISTIGIYQQIKYINKKDLGYEKSNLVRLNDHFLSPKKITFKKTISGINGVQSVSMAASDNSKILSSNGTMTMNDPFHPEKNIEIDYLLTDPDFLSTFKLKLIKGKDLKDFMATSPLSKAIYKEKKYNTISGYANNQPILITRFTAKRLGIEELNKPYKSLDGIPVGIVENFHTESLRKPIKPEVIQTDPHLQEGNLFIRLQKENQAATLKVIAQKFEEFFPNQPFDYSYVEDLLEKEYRSESKLLIILLSLSILIIFLSSLGLFGLLTYSIQTRTKEISIRKVLGASSQQIWLAISSGSFKLLFIAILVAVPLSWYALNEWLLNYPYRIEISTYLFLTGISIAMLIAIGTTSIKILSISNNNPANNLRAN